MTFFVIEMFTNVKANTSTNAINSRFMQKILTRYIGKMITIITQVSEIPIIGNFTRSWPRKFVSLLNLLDKQRMFIRRNERPVSRVLHFKFRRLWFLAIKHVFKAIFGTVFTVTVF